MAKKPLSIKDWNLGVGESPYVGFGQMVNVDTFTQPGSVKISNRLERDINSVGVVTELIIWTAQDPRTADVYGVDRQGTLYKRAAGTTLWSIIAGHGLVGALGQGIAIWNDYLFYARSNRLDVYGPLTGVPTWTNNWQNLNNSDTHPMLNAMDGHLYIGDAGFVSQLIHLTTTPFDPANGATYSWNSPQLTLNPNYIVSTLEDYNGVGAAAGTKYGVGGTINIADMFFWDGASDSYTTPGTTRFADDGVQMTKNVGGVYFTIAGTGTPRIFRSVSAQAVETRRLNNVGNGNVRLFAAAIGQKDGEILFGIGQSLGTGGLNPMGVYSLRSNITGSFSYVNRYLISTGRDGSNGVLMIGSVTVLNANQILVSWYDSLDPDVFGVDVLSISNFYTGYKAYIESPLYAVGTEDDPTTFEKIEVRLGKRLRTGDGVIVQARKSLDQAYVTIATIDTPTYVGRDVIDTKVGNIGAFKDAQFKILMTTASNSVESPELKEVTLR